MNYVPANQGMQLPEHKHDGKHAKKTFISLMKVKTLPLSVVVLIAAGIMVIVTIAVGTTLTIFKSREQTLSETERKLDNTALIVAEHTDQVFQSIDLIEKSLVEQIQKFNFTSAADFRARMSGDDTNAMLIDRIAGLPQIIALILVDAKGKIFNVSLPLKKGGPDVTDRDYFKAFKANPKLTTFLSAPLQNRSDGRWSIVQAHKVTASNGEFLGLFLIGTDLAYFERFFSSIAAGKESAIAMFQEDGTLLSRYPVTESLTGKKLRGLQIFRNVLDKSDHGTTRAKSRLDGKNRLIAGHRLARRPFVITVTTTESDALTQWRGHAQFLAVIGALACIMVAAIVYLFVRQMLEGIRRAEHALGEQELKLDTALNNMSQGLLMFDSMERLVVCNQRFIEMYGLSSDVIKPGCTLDDILNHRKERGSLLEDLEQYRANIIDGIAQGKRISRFSETPDGRTIHALRQPMPNGWWLVTHEDITEQRKVQDERDRSRAFVDLIIDNVPQFIVVRDAKSFKYVLANRASERMFGKKREEVVGKTPHELFSSKIADFIIEQDKQVLETRKPVFNDEHEISTPGEGKRTHTSTRVPILDVNGKPEYLLAVIEDATERKRARDQILHLAHYDSLTDLPNRTLFRTQLEEALNRARNGGRMAVLYLDLDHFKKVNDTLGHSVGDDLLKAAALRLRECIGSSDSVARLGGDEFAVIQNKITDPADILTLVKRISDALKKPYELPGHQFVGDVSIGIAVAPDDGLEPDLLLKNADMALYGAKADGRGTYRFFDSKMELRTKERRRLEIDLRKAIENDQLELYYQPIVRLSDDTVTSCEALVRWSHPELGAISPVDFIPIAEETGLITAVGDWVLRRACADAATWPKDVRVAINLSPAQFRSPSLTLAVTNAILNAGLIPSRLEIEITESVLMQNNDFTISALNQLRAIGVHIALDDFGTGYSSLSYLRSFPFDKIKIDRSFVNDLTDSSDALEIVQTIANLARVLNMVSTAEGVENEQQLDIIRKAGCAEAQGFYFSVPKPNDDLLRDVFSPQRRKQHVTAG